MYRYEWSVLATPALLDELRQAAGDAVPADDALRDAVVRVLSLVGGLPVADERWDAAMCTARGRSLLREALLRLVRGEGRNADLDQGHLATPVSRRREADEWLRALPRVALNQADAATLRGLGLSAAVAERIVLERQRGGPFSSLTDLDRRVRGIGERAVQEMASAVHFEPPTAQPWPFSPVHQPYDAAAMAADLARLVAMQRAATPRAQLLAALDAMAVTAQGHPARRMARVRRGGRPPASGTLPAAWVGVWFGGAYYERLQVLLAAAQASVEVCMFHAAANDARHPTFKLLEALVQAKGRGVQVRVLLDRDRNDDPYRSTVINTPARQHLESAGVPCRFDTSERLLHSKVVLVDGHLCVVGSHNWSAGSYFQFDDLSLLVDSAPLHAQMRMQFDQLWAAAS